MTYIPDTHIGKLNDAHAILSWNAIDARLDCSPELGNAMERAMWAVGHVIDLHEREKATSVQRLVESVG